MNEKKKALIVLFGLAAMLVIIVAAVISSLIDSNKKIEEVKKIMNSETAKIVYLEKESCYYCNLLKPITDSLQEEFDLDYHKIDTSKLSNIELTKVLKTLEIDYDSFGTPYIVIVKDGKKIDEHVGYTDEDVLFKLFQDNGIIEETKTLNMTYLDDVDTVFNSSDSSLLLVGESGDANSIEARITLRNIAKENSLDIKYFDVSKLTDNNEYSILLNKLEVDELPVLAKIENGVVVSKENEITKSKYQTFLKNNGYID